MTQGDGRGLRYRVAQFLGWVMLLGVFGILAASFMQRDESCTPEAVTNLGKTVFADPPCVTIDDGPLYEAVLKTSEGEIVVLLEPRIARTTVNNFVFLARNGVYDGTIFHRIETDADHAIIQGGDPTGTGLGTAGYFYTGELPSPLTQYKRGVIAMVDHRPDDELGDGGAPPKNGSQFFLVARDWDAIGPPNEIPRFTFFGRVFDPDGLAVLDRIAALGDPQGNPSEIVVLERVTIRVIERYEPVPTFTPTPEGS